MLFLPVRVVLFLVGLRPDVKVLLCSEDQYEILTNIACEWHRATRSLRTQLDESSKANKRKTNRLHQLEQQYAADCQKFTDRIDFLENNALLDYHAKTTGEGKCGQSYYVEQRNFEIQIRESIIYVWGKLLGRPATSADMTHVHHLFKDMSVLLFHPQEQLLTTIHQKEQALQHLLGRNISFHYTFFVMTV